MHLVKQVAKAWHSNFQCVPSLQCCEQWTDLALLPAIVVTCSYLNWSCSAYWTTSDLHTHYLWHIAMDRQDEDRAATQLSQIHAALTKLESSPISLVHENTNQYPTTPWWGHRHSSREDAKINNSLLSFWMYMKEKTLTSANNHSWWARARHWVFSWWILLSEIPPKQRNIFLMYFYM